MTPEQYKNLITAKIKELGNLDKQELENSILKLVERLENGEKIIEDRKLKGVDISRQETLYLELLANYVALQEQYVSLFGCSFEHYLKQGV